jgi:hypothetical protein
MSRQLRGARSNPTMLNRLSDLVRLRTFANEQVQPVPRVDMDALRDLLPGDYVRAQIEAVLPDGTFRVAIRNQALLLRLPVQAQAGDRLQLSVVAREPHLKFALVMEDDPAALSTSLSETARFITALLDESDKLPHTPAARAGAPLLAGFPGDSAQTATVLRNALTHSGMFYEAHLAQWVAGERTLVELMREPQTRLAPLRTARRVALPDGRDEAEPSVIIDGTPHLPELPVHRDALTMIKQQLDTLESRHVAWHGMIWHGQPLDWEVTEEPSASPQSAEAAPWRTRLRLKLPHLGAIDATLLVAARGVTITLQADDTKTLAALTDQRADLQKSLREAGVTPLGITVRRHEPA